MRRINRTVKHQQRPELTSRSGVSSSFCTQVVPSQSMHANSVDPERATSIVNCLPEALTDLQFRWVFQLIQRLQYAIPHVRPPRQSAQSCDLACVTASQSTYLTNEHIGVL